MVLEVIKWLFVHFANIMNMETSGQSKQRWFDGMGINVKCNSNYWSNLQNRVDNACDHIFRCQQLNFIKILRRQNPNITAILDGTYSQRGHNSQDCFAWDSQYFKFESNTDLVPV